MRLLRKTFISFSIYAIIVILVAVPLFYIIINKMFINDVDEALRQQKNVLSIKLNHLNAAAIYNWQYLDSTISISQLTLDDFKESIYTVNHYNKADGENEPYREFVTPIAIHGKNYKMTLRMSLVNSEDLSEGIVINLAILLILLLVGLLLLNHFQSKKIWRPFYQTLSRLKQFELDKNPHLSLTLTKVHEFNDLNQAIFQLTEKNYQVYLQQKEFTENAAHELQTPLAIFQSKLDLLLQNENLDQEQADIIQSLNDTTHRMIKLNRSLLLLAKIENRQFIDVDNINPSEVINKLLFQYADHIKATQITVNTKLDERVNIKANPVLADILFSNLLSNAIRHNIRKGNMDIMLDKQTLLIENSGVPLKFDQDKIFNRFQKDESQPGNTGLGMAIIKQICETSGFDIQYNYDNGRHNIHIIFS